MNRKFEAAANRAQALLEEAGIHLTLGGEPTFVPIDPVGAEWNFTAVGPTKLDYAKKMAAVLVKTAMPGALQVLAPGKLYPGEVNPRWVVRLIARKHGGPFWNVDRTTSAEPTLIDLETAVAALGSSLKMQRRWMSFRDPNAPLPIFALPLDYTQEEGWKTAVWPMKALERVALAAPGPAGLRLPLQLLPEDALRRALTLEIRDGELRIFLPPLPMEGFESLVALIENICTTEVRCPVAFDGYVPPDLKGEWVILGLAADPGVLEINIPACRSLQEYAGWIGTVNAAAQQCGLRPWKEVPGDAPVGSGGGNHLLWGGATIEENPFFTRPAWLVSILRYFQHHPCLAYLFTGHYVGSASQAPRTDESARDLYDLEMAYRFLESLPEGDHRVNINETLRHLHTDVTGNSHRAEASFDKFWNPASPAGCLGLIEFRAIETVPHAEWTAAIALLWSSIAARCAKVPFTKPLKNFGMQLKDRYFLPSVLWGDLTDIFADLEKTAGIQLDTDVYRALWEWKFPLLLSVGRGGARLSIRRAHESWPLLCETPVEGGSTSRFVDTSMRRLEFAATEAFLADRRIYVAEREVCLQPVHGDLHLAGLRYRHSNLYPSLHPGIPVQLPLALEIRNAQNRRISVHELTPTQETFAPADPIKGSVATLPPCKPGRTGDMTYDLRIL